MCYAPTEDAGFIGGRSCADQIFDIRTLIEQSSEWNSLLYINFLDFEKAFDSIQHNTLWSVLRSYGFPNKVINILSHMYVNNRCVMCEAEDSTVPGFRSNEEFAKAV